MTSRTGSLVLIITLALLATVSAAPKFVSTWKAPEAAGTSFAGKKIAALVISSDDNLRISGEEALVRELAAIGIKDGVAAYRLVPREELQDAAKARPWFERAGIEGVVTLRLVRAETERTYTPAYWAAPAYTSLWGYYGYGWGVVYQPGSQREDTIVVIENLIFSVAKDKLLWAGVSETTNPKNAGTIIKDLVKETLKEMRKEKLIR
jgi:hypothetical protein